jgi:hypothetical protein
MQAVDHHAHHIIGGRPRQGSDEAYDLEIVEIPQLLNLATPPPQHTTPLAQDDPVVPNLQTTPEWRANVEALTTQAGVDRDMVRFSAPNSRLAVIFWGFRTPDIAMFCSELRHSQPGSGLGLPCLQEM